MPFTDPEKFQFVEAFIEEGKNHAKFVRRVRREQGRSVAIPPERTLKDWLQRLRDTGSAQSRQGKFQPK
jgi:hypothetical protein